MKRLLLVTVGIVLVWANVYGANFIVNDSPDRLETNLLASHQLEVTINIGQLGMTEADGGYSLELSDEFSFGKGQMQSPGETVLPTYSMLLGVPEDAPLSVIVDEAEYVDFDDFELSRVTDSDLLPLKPLTESGVWQTVPEHQILILDPEEPPELLSL